MDFNVSSSFDIPAEPSDYDVSNGLVTEYTLKRKVRAVSGETVSTTFSIGAPTKFRTILLPGTNIIDIIRHYSTTYYYIFVFNILVINID